jgi:LuxR family maltose regulon positive regulatory protein
MHWVEQRIAGRSDPPLPLAGAAHIGLGKLWYEWNDLAAARHHLETGIELAHPRGGLGLARHGILALAFVYQAQGDAAGARRLLQQAEELARQSPRADAVARLQPFKVRMWLAQGDLTAGWRWAQESSLDPGRPPVYPLEVDYVMLARVYLTRPTAEHLARAAALLAQALSVAEGHGRKGRVIEILLLQALVFHVRRDTDRSLAVLQRSLTLAEPEGYCRTFVDEGEPMRTRIAELRALMAEPRLQAYADQLLAAFSETASVPPISSTLPQRQAALVEPLTERELEVLRLIVTGLSNREIADKLILAEGTVKKYTNNIFGKLGVQRRSQAIARATALALV